MTANGDIIFFSFSSIRTEITAGERHPAGALEATAAKGQAESDTEPLAPLAVRVDPPTEYIALRQNGERFPVEITISLLQAEKGVLITSAIRDITERRSTERQIRLGKLAHSTKS